MPAETLFSVRVEPDAYGRASGTVTLDSYSYCAPRRAGPDWIFLQRALGCADGPPFGQALAQQMFTFPEYDWKVTAVAGTLGINTRPLQMRLFREAYSFASTLRRCRILRIFLSALSTDLALPHAAPPIRTAESERRLDAIFQAAFQTRLSTIAKSRLPMAGV